MDDAISSFFDERKAAWLKKKLKSSLSESEVQVIEREADEKFSLENWLPNAAKRSKQLSLNTHVSKFTHPSAKTSPVLATASQSADGLVRTGNAAVEPDVLVGNAAALDVYAFLALKLRDGKSILKHLQNKTALIQVEFQLKDTSFEEIAAGLLQIQNSEEKPATHGKVKQVYFPVGDDYHLLSLLTPSNLMFELSDRIKEMRFSEATKKAREDRRAQRHNPEGFAEIYGLTMIGYGGAHPKNISVANKDHLGKAYLLPSLPPQLDKRELRLPRQNFFGESFYFGHYRHVFKELHAIFKSEARNYEVREQRKAVLHHLLFDSAVSRIWEIRAQGAGWSQSDWYAHLLQHQKVGLDALHEAERQEGHWVKAFIRDFIRWFQQGYEKSTKQLTPAIQLSDHELRAFRHELERHQEVLL